MKCINAAWDEHEAELRQYFINKVSEPAIADDLLQDVFVKALAQKGKFCELKSSRAWLFRVAINRLTDYRRTHKIHNEVSDSIPEYQELKEPVVKLSNCLPTALKKLEEQDKEVIELCDLEGLSQIDYSKLKNISLPAAKSRIQRARKRLKIELHTACQIILDDKGRVCCFNPEC